ncbi:MAG: carboxypeptidase regulatory-like domain-containing protein [Chloroflexi bacterium]|nr:carboxypeptidase regulatory-like domain-containing protein [Chloroflexota bacterium]
MSFSSPAHRIPRQSIVGMEGMFAKMWDPPTVSPSTPDKRSPTNPVPEVIAAAGLADIPSASHTVQRDLLHGARLSAWDSKEINFYLFRDADIPATGGGNFPGATIRVPRGVWFHGETLGHGPPPHTIHWHGIEPTPINDGVGHCSMEVGHYTYQWQPNFIGFYFCHCHRNTVQHFEFGLYQALLIDPPDAFFATQWDRTIPLGAGRDRKRRIAANLNIIGTETSLGSGQGISGAGFETLTTRTDAQVQVLWPGYMGGLITDADPEAGNAALPAYLKFPVNPHAKTVPYDVEALWVVDDRDSRWSDEAPDARATYPKHGSIVGDNDNFRGNAGGGTDSTKFFAFNDFNPDYWYVTGVNFPGPKGGSGTIPAGIVIPPSLICGTATQVSVEAEVGQTILIRALDGAYNNVTYRFPVDVTVIAWDGRALGVEPFNAYNHAYTVPAGQPIHSSVARRFDALIRVNTAINGFAEVDFTDTRCGTANGFARPVLFTGRIPMNIGYAISGTITDGSGVALEGVTVSLSGNVNRTTITDRSGKYRFSGLLNGAYTVTPSLIGYGYTPESLNLTVSGASLTGQNFTATQTPGLWVINGAVVSSRGEATGIPNIIMTLSGGGTPDRKILTDAEGHYHFTGVPDGNYTVTAGNQLTGNGGTPGDTNGPSVLAYYYSPTSIDVTIIGANQTLGFIRGRRKPHPDVLP